MFCIFCTLPPPKLHPSAPLTCHCLTPFQFSLCCNGPPPPHYPIHRATVHMDISPNRRPPLIVSMFPSLAVLNCLPRSLPPHGVPHYTPLSSVFLIHFPPFAALDLRPAPCQLLGVIPSMGHSLPLLDFLPLSYAPSLPASTCGSVPTVTEVFEL